MWIRHSHYFGISLWDRLCRANPGQQRLLLLLIVLYKIQEENYNHVLRCPSIEAKDFRTQQIVELRELLDKLQTFSLLRNRIMSMLLQWMAEFDMLTSPTTDDSTIMKVNAALCAQSWIDVRTCFRGLVAQQIIDVQAEYYKNHKGDKKNTITRWNRMVVNKFITMAIQFWKNRCELVHKKDKSIIESYARTSANDLCKKLLNTVWFLPSASRHLLEHVMSSGGVVIPLGVINFCCLE